MERNGGFWILTRVLPSKRGARDIELACDVSADRALEGRRGTVVSTLLISLRSSWQITAGHGSFIGPGPGELRAVSESSSKSNRKCPLGVLEWSMQHQKHSGGQAVVLGPEAENRFAEHADASLDLPFCAMWVRVEKGQSIQGVFCSFPSPCSFWASLGLEVSKCQYPSTSLAVVGFMPFRGRPQVLNVKQLNKQSQVLPGRSLGFFVPVCCLSPI